VRMKRSIWFYASAAKDELRRWGGREKKGVQEGLARLRSMLVRKRVERVSVSGKKRDEHKRVQEGEQSASKKWWVP